MEGLLVFSTSFSFLWIASVKLNWPSQVELYLGKQKKKVTGSKVRHIRWLGNDCCKPWTARQQVMCKCAHCNDEDFCPSFLGYLWEMFSLRHFKTLQYDFTFTVWPSGMNSLWTVAQILEKVISINFRLLWTWMHFCSASLKREASSMMAVALCQGYNHKLMIHLQLWPWECWHHLWHVSWAFSRPVQCAFCSSPNSCIINLAVMHLMFKMHWMLLYDSPAVSWTSQKVYLQFARIIRHS